MDCREVQEKLSAYVDRELVPAAEESIRQHLGDCEHCAEQYAKLLSGWEALDAWEDATPPDRMRKKILEAATPQMKAFPVRAILSIAAALLLVVGTAVLYSGQKSQTVQNLARSQSPDQAGAVGDISEDEIIANLLILQENDFYEALDELVKIDELPLDEESSNGRRGPERCSLDLV